MKKILARQGSGKIPGSFQQSIHLSLKIYGRHPDPMKQLSAGVNLIFSARAAAGGWDAVETSVPELNLKIRGEMSLLSDAFILMLIDSTGKRTEYRYSVKSELLRNGGSVALLDRAEMNGEPIPSLPGVGAYSGIDIYPGLPEASSLIVGLDNCESKLSNP